MGGQCYTKLDSRLFDLGQKLRNWALPGGLFPLETNAFQIALKYRLRVLECCQKGFCLAGVSAVRPLPIDQGLLTLDDAPTIVDVPTGARITMGPSGHVAGPCASGDPESS
jgi:hypothetical protein